MGKARTASKSAAAVESSESQEEVSDLIDREPESVRLAVKLSPKQRLALEAFRAGRNTAEAARRANVDPSTVRRWLSHDAKFIAAHNAVILENITSSRADTASLLPLANAALQKDLKKGNGWLALQFMREARSLGVLEVGPTSPKAVKEELKIAREMHEAELMKKQVQLREQREEIDKLKEKLDRDDAKKIMESPEEEAYWYAFMAFYSDWKRHRNNLEQAEMKYLAFGSVGGCSAEQFRRISDDADRRQQLDQEKKQRGEHVKSAEQQANEMRALGLRLHQQRQKEWDEAQRKSDERNAGNQPGAAAQQSSNDKEPAPASQPRQRLNIVDQSLADLRAAQAEFGADDDLDDEDDEDDEAWEAKAWADAEKGKANSPEATEPRPTQEPRPAESEKSNPDVGPSAASATAQQRPFDSASLAQGGPPGVQRAESDANERDKLNHTDKPRESEPIETDDFEE